MGVWEGDEFIISSLKRKNGAYGFNRILLLRYKKAYTEIGINIKTIDDNYAIYPKSYYTSIAKLGYEKDIDFTFIGIIGKDNPVALNRVWVSAFVDDFITDKSYFKDTMNPENYLVKGTFDYTIEGGGFVPRFHRGKKACKFDRTYFSILSRSKFCLCPAGDCPWSMRFYEAIMCKSIPIVKYKWETWRSYAESKLDYKFYLADDKEFIYREDWAEHNYALFMKYHTLESINIKCNTDGCNFLVHSNIKNNNGLYCCKRCKFDKLHGLKCQKKVFNKS
jgi:hypothetical protein